VDDIVSNNQERMIRAREEISTCAISGAVGTFATVDPRVEDYVAGRLGLKVEPVSTQVIPRDRHAMFFATLAVIGASIENLATEIRHLQRSEVREAEEFFAAGQKGSSAMPHKRNPVLSENLTGLARLIRSSITPALEDVTLWHERDISHSAVERVIAPDTTILVDFALNRLNGVMENLLVHPRRMRENFESLRGLVFSQAVLLALTQAGMKRECAYKVVQEHAMKVWDSEEADFLSLLQSDKTVSEYLSKEALQDIFNDRRYIERTAEVIDRVLTAYA
jgi:adenylosuccinate lyase